MRFPNHKGICFLVFLLIVSQLSAQHFNIHNPLSLPNKSQRSVISQRIGYTDITISYHSPGARDREVWGDLIPYGKVWRAGANTNTIFTITDSVHIGGKVLPAGMYGLHLLPEEDQWNFSSAKAKRLRFACGCAAG